MNKDYEIKMDGNEHKFGDATRYTKDGKGRFDLIPGDIIADIIDRADNMGDDQINETLDTTVTDVITSAMNGDYAYAILNMCVVEYGDEICELCMMEYEEIDREYILNMMFPRMLKELAIHFQKGAEKYGERNCEKGIPLWSFRDSGLRHMCQWLIGETDENHFIAAIWNFVMAMWTIKHHPERCADADKELPNIADTSEEDKNKMSGKITSVLGDFDEFVLNEALCENNTTQGNRGELYTLKDKYLSNPFIKSRCGMLVDIIQRSHLLRVLLCDKVDALEDAASSGIIGLNTLKTIKSTITKAVTNSTVIIGDAKSEDRSACEYCVRLLNEMIVLF